jgi:phosphatidate phosphatase LPIN
MELLELAGYKSSYIHMSDLVDHFFPPARSGLGVDEEYTDLRYWKVPLPELSDESEDEEDEEGEEGEEGEEEGEEGEDEEEGDEEVRSIYVVSDVL